MKNGWKKSGTFRGDWEPRTSMQWNVGASEGLRQTYNMGGTRREGSVQPTTDCFRAVNVWRTQQKMIAYRSETAMVGLMRGPTVDSSDARSLLQGLFVTDADIIPDVDSKKLRVRIHGASTPAANQSMVQLFEQLNETETKYPGTDLQLVYESVTQNRSKIWKTCHWIFPEIKSFELRIDVADPNAHKTHNPRETSIIM